MRASLTLRAILTAALTLAGCASLPRQADQAFDAGDYARAVAAYERCLRQAPRGPDADRQRFRLGLTFVLPESLLHDPEKGEVIFRELASRPASSPYRAAAALILGLQDAVRAGQEAAGRQREELTRVADGAKVLEASLRAKEEALQRLRAALAEEQVQVRRLHEELEQLKKIDQRRTP